ncbi:MAG: adenylosuccinate synthase [Acidaminococcales bacterium]|jgi:adenylosuccinate synthase|nr:adenylosuccinate synthase [Acidaminococcales bacterium]
MPSVVVVGAQWGDEGKGKIVDYLAEKSDIVVRYSGGSNAGHTVVVAGEEYKLRLLPSGILHPGKLCVLANGVALDAKVILGEIEAINRRGIDTGNLRVSDRAHVIMPYHQALDKLQEEYKGAGKIGTTQSGIGPCYADKMARTGIRVCDLMDEEIFAAKLKNCLAEKNLLLDKIYGAPGYDFAQVFAEYMEYARKLRPYVVDTGFLLARAMEGDKKIMYEGAQATFLDIDHGSYPYVTSSNPIAGGVCTGAGVGPKSIGTVVGVVKAYSTRVGEGPFVTELSDEIGSHIRDRGQEYGTVTKRPRRCGWVDAAVVRYAAQLSGMDYLAITRLDILDQLPKVKICTGYSYKGRRIDYMPASLKELAKCQPLYEELPGWQADISSAEKYGDLPANARRYVERLSELSGAPLGIVSVGPGRTQTIVLADLL